jgi:hypothetical protein
MADLKPIKKALDSVNRKKEQIASLRHFKKNVSGYRSRDRSLYSESLVVWDDSGNNKSSLKPEVIEMMFPADDAITRANYCIELLETELADLNVLLGAFSTVMEPILKDQT